MVKYFEPIEFKQYDMLSKELLVSLEQFRGDLGSPIKILSDYAVDGHSKNSWHYKGMAIDGTTKAPLYLFMSLAIKYFNGIGIYIESVTRNISYFHLDMRTDSKQMWVGLVDSNTRETTYIYATG